ncbi:transcriptional regulator [Kribbella antibiotica]|uniref:Transcriptional regulator n=1 Tax=Kribbella antibiotica TaxID=190195 RepID=A0A4R4Z2Q0_9ACTN|nr:transcriptional regulator [Kribbella antibiotica]TDD52301.1 transcriptional regulator [Kribbella antibiotica]
MDPASWMAVRRKLVANRYSLAVAAADEYPADRQVSGTPLLAPASWIPAEPVPLASIRLEFDADAVFTGVTGREAPLPAEFATYAEAIRGMAPPAVFEDRPTYRLTFADLAGAEPVLRFGRGTYFDSINTGEAAAHEYAAGVGGLRAAIGDPWDVTRRPTNVAISTLTIRAGDEPTFFLHWRDPAKVGHAGGLYQVVPVGIFQPSADAPENEQNDFSLWRNVVRELAEELLGESEDYGDGPIDYDDWPFAARLAAGLADGSVRAYCVGLGVDPLTFATDLLTVVSIDAPLFDDLFGAIVEANDEGRVLAPQPFTAEVVDTFVHHQPMQAAGAALLHLAFVHAAHL